MNVRRPNSITRTNRANCKTELTQRTQCDLNAFLKINAEISTSQLFIKKLPCVLLLSP